MSQLGHDNDAGLADFEDGWRKAWETEPVTLMGAMIGLTNFGERPVQSTRLAKILGWPVSDVEALARQGEWLGTRVEDGAISLNPERAGSPPRRHAQIGARRFGVTGCAPDIFLWAPLVRPSLVLDETCTITGTPIRIVFTPGCVESVDPPGAVVPMPSTQASPQVLDCAEGRMSPAECDANICVQFPFYASLDAAQGFLARFHGGRVFPVREAWDLSFVRGWRDRMSALLDLGD